MFCFRMVLALFCVFFFFKQRTAYEMLISDWSSDVCSSDLISIESLPLPKGLRIYALITPPQQSWPNGTITDEGIYLSVFRWLVSVIESLDKRSSNVK